MNIPSIHKLFLTCPGFTTDTRTITKDSIYFALKGENYDGNNFAKEALEKGAKYVVVDNINLEKHPSFIFVYDVLKALQDLSSYHIGLFDIPVIAITGSNGKTTSKELINCVLSKRHKTIATLGNYNNHIGVPLTLLRVNSTTDIAIIEMGANNFEEISFLCSIAKPNYGYITNFGKAHLEGFGSLEGVIKAKSEMYDYLKQSKGIAFVNKENTKQIEITSNQETILFDYNSLGVNVKSLNPEIELSLGNNTIKTNMFGDYNITNIMSAIAIGKHFGVNNSDIKTALEDYKPNNKRSQILQTKTNKLVLDAYNANPSSVTAALDSFKQFEAKNKIVILGDMMELGDDSINEHLKIYESINNFKNIKSFFIGDNFSKATDNKNNCFISLDKFISYIEA
ncbi:MAG: UDP-N-acetylmuramoyl-tripeptide--D-alanyl-D-alanine ligase, partial [Flavobacteriaceae bacterium]|nr:UDP-N-acetylmuramoyl-tripeptide--D-alanyl-D-alanine ligase [Flavobacteriaceae bacterium]